MSFSNFLVTKGAGASPVNGGYARIDGNGDPIIGTDDSALVERSNCSSQGGGVAIVNDDATGWGVAAIDDRVCFDINGVKEFTRITNISTDTLSVSPPVTGGLSGKNVRVGGAWSTINHGIQTINPQTFNNGAGDPVRFNIQAGSLWSEYIWATQDGSRDKPLIIEGYTSKFGDGGEAELDGTGQLAGGGAIDFDAKFLTAKNLYARPTVSQIHGVHLGAEDCQAVNVRASATGSGAHAFQLSGQGTRVIGCTALDAAVHNFFMNGAYSEAIGCIGLSAGVSAFSCGASLGQKMSYCIGAGSASHVFALWQAAIMLHCIAYGSVSGSGVSAATTSGKHCSVRNCILAANAAYGIVRGNNGVIDEDYNAFWNNSSGERSNVLIPGANDISLSGDPFVDAANDDFRLNGVAGGGALCRNAGYPQFADIGAHPLRWLGPHGLTNVGAQM